MRHDARRFVSRLASGALLLLLALGGSSGGQASSADYIRGDLTLLTSNGARVDWSPDGGTIYFDRLGADGYYDIWRMAPDGAGQTCVTCDHPQLPNRNQGNPKVDPTGRYLVLQAEKASHAVTPTYLTEPGIGRFNDLWVLDLVANNAYPLTNVSPTGVSGLLHPHFNRSGTKLLWSHIEGAGSQFDNMAILVADFVTTPQPHLESPVAYNPGPNPGWIETHGWGPDDSWVYFSCTPLAGMEDVSADICRMDFANPTQVTRLTFSSGLNGEPGEWDEHAHLSPQGDSIVYMSSRPYPAPPYSQIVAQLKTDAWLMNADGSGHRQITFFNQPGHPDNSGERAIVSDMDWDPDGRRLVMRVQFRDSPSSPQRIYTLDLCADADADQLCDAAELPYPPDAIDVQTSDILPEDDLTFSSIRYLASQPPAGDQWYPEVFALDVETMQSHRITYMSDQALRHMALSPDHRKLAITRAPSDTNGNGELDEMDNQVVWIVNLVDGKAWPLTEAGASAGTGGVDWLDNQTVVFAYKPPGGALLEIAKADYRTRARTLLTNTPTVAETDVGAADDGTLITYIAVDTTEVLGVDQFGPILKGTVWLMNSDGSNQRRITDGGPIVGRAGMISAGDFDPELSPDNQKVVFGRTTALGTNDIDPTDEVPPGGTDRIFTADVNTLAVTELTQNTSVALVPDWAADGTIYFSEIAITPEHFPNPYLGIASTTESGGLTRMEPFPPPELWKGALIAKLIPARDTDGDGYGDSVDGCPATPTVWPTPSGDGDCDGFTTADETAIGTLALVACGANAWPPDFDGNQMVDIGDVLALKMDFGATVPPASVRFDISPSGVIDISDVLALKPFFGAGC